MLPPPRWRPASSSSSTTITSAFSPEDGAQEDVEEGHGERVVQRRLTKDQVVEQRHCIDVLEDA